MPMAESEDAGVYKCTAKNQAGWTTKTTSVTVHGECVATRRAPIPSLSFSLYIYVYISHSQHITDDLSDRTLVSRNYSELS